MGRRQTLTLVLTRHPLVATARTDGVGGVRAGAGDQRGGGDCTGSAQEEAEKQGKDDSRVFSLVTLKVGAANS